MNFKPNKKNILFGIVGLIVGFILQLFLPSLASCPEIVGGACQANVKNWSLILEIGLAAIGYVLGSVLTKKGESK